MLNITPTIAEAAGTKLAATYRHYYGDQEAPFATIRARIRSLIENVVSLGSRASVSGNGRLTIISFASCFNILRS